MQTGRVVFLNDEGLPGALLNFTRGFRRFVELSFPFVFFEPHEIYNSHMGRMRIKKKEVVLPFRQTLAYRMILLTASIVVFIVAVTLMIRAMYGTTATFIGTAAVAAAAAFAVFYNLSHLREAKVPKQTLQRMKRR
jgi:hypothetical protein